MENFRFKGNKLLWNNYSLDIIAKKNKTPFYLYSYNQLKTNVSYFKKTFNKTNPLICFSLNILFFSVHLSRIHLIFYEKTLVYFEYKKE